MNPESGNIYGNLSELMKGEEEKGVKVDVKNLIRFGIGDRFEIRGLLLRLQK